MTDVADLLRVAGRLKQELVAFGRRPRFARAFRAMVGGPSNLSVGAEDELIHKIDSLNPEKLERGWQLQREERARFIEFFGADLVVLPAAQMHERMREYHQSWRHRATGHLWTGRCSAVRVRQRPLAPSTTRSTDFGRVAAAFANPELVTGQPYRRTIQSYLRDDSVTPLPFRRLADQALVTRAVCSNCY